MGFLLIKCISKSSPDSSGRVRGSSPLECTSKSPVKHNGYRAFVFVNYVLIPLWYHFDTISSGRWALLFKIVDTFSNAIRDNFSVKSFSRLYSNISPLVVKILIDLLTIIKLARLQWKLSTTQTAEWAGVKRVTLWQIEKGSTYFSGNVNDDTREVDMYEDKNAKGSGKFTGTINKVRNRMSGSWSRYSDGTVFNWNLESMETGAQ
mgnify:CR=1 FL=1